MIRSPWCLCILLVTIFVVDEGDAFTSSLLRHKKDHQQHTPPTLTDVELKKGGGGHTPLNLQKMTPFELQQYFKMKNGQRFHHQTEYLGPTGGSWANTKIGLGKVESGEWQQTNGKPLPNTPNAKAGKPPLPKNVIFGGPNIPANDWLPMRHVTGGGYGNRPAGPGAQGDDNNDGHDPKRSGGKSGSKHGDGNNSPYQPGGAGGGAGGNGNGGVITAKIDPADSSAKADTPGGGDAAAEPSKTNTPPSASPSGDKATIDPQQQEQQQQRAASGE